MRKHKTQLIMKIHKTKLMRLTLLLMGILIMVSCENVFKEILFPSSCKRCDVVNENSSKVYSSEEGCGGGNVDIEDRAKVTAYDLNAGYRETRYFVRCETWEEDPVE